jgi:hypothetical protein
MNVQLSFDPVALLFDGLWEGIKMLFELVVAAPLWVQAIVVAMVIIRIFWPQVLAKEERRPRRRRRRRWRHASWH